VVHPGVDLAAKVGSCGDYDRPGALHAPVPETNAPNAAMGVNQSHSLTANDGYPGVGGYPPEHRGLVEVSVHLRPAGTNGESPTGVEVFELDGCRVGDPRHLPIERVEFSYQVPFGLPSHSRIARHPADGSRRKCEEYHLRTSASCGKGRLDSGMSSTDNYDRIDEARGVV